MRPATERERGAALATVDRLDSAQENTREFERTSFKDALKKAIEAATPKPTTEEQAERVVESGAQTASAAVQGQLTEQRDTAAGPLRQPGEVAPSDLGAAPPEVPLRPEQVGEPPAPVSAAPAVPPPLPPERLDYSEDRAATDRAMEENGISSAQLEKGNEPEFGQTLEARSEAEEHESQAVSTYRSSEMTLREGAQQRAQGAVAGGLSAMHGARAGAIGKVAGEQVATMTKDEAERRHVTTTIERIKNETRSDVDAILREMDTEASRIFTEGLAAAESAYRDTFEAEKGGVGTWLTTWGSDWEELIESSLATARDEYLRHVNLAIDRVADCVDAKLAAAKKRVLEGRVQVQTFVDGLEGSVRMFGEQALATVSDDFDAMTESIDARKDALVDSLTTQFKASYERMSAMEEELRNANKSLWQRVYDATVGVIKKILAFKDLLLSVLAKAADVVTDIITDPIGFLGNLVSGVALGLKNFVANIGRHLKKGLMDWLFGALAGAGITMPETLDLKGIVSIVLQVLGLTYANFRARAVKIVGEPVVSALERTAEIFTIVASEGVPGLWRFIKDKVAELKSMVLDAIFDFIKEKVIVAGITWLVGLLNPASAFFKACKAIYDIIMFFINRGSQILALVNAVLDSVAAIAKGSIGVAAKLVEEALAKAVPVAIGFLAGLLGLGDISGTIRKTIDKARSPVNDAIDWVINQAVKLVKAVGRVFSGATGERDERAAPPTSEELIDQPVTMVDGTHHLKNDGPGGQLLLHTNPTLVNSIENTALQALITQFNAATTMAERDRLAVEIAQWIATNMPAVGPGGSAPNLGNTGRHGSQPPRLVNQNVPLWSLRSEHVVPYAVVSRLWVALGVEGLATRKQLNTQDRALTTIMIYMGAGNAKDRGEGQRRSAAAAHINDMTKIYEQRPDADTPAADAIFRSEVISFLREEEAWFASFTSEKVQEEHATPIGATTHGALREEATPVPTVSDVASAAAEEIDDADRILGDALEESRPPPRQAPRVAGTAGDQ